MQGEVGTQNQCHVAAIKLPGGLETGEVRFSFQDYRESGKYEVRYFLGDSRDGQGVVCRAFQGTATPSRICGLEAKAVSAPINIQPRFADGSQQHLSTEVSDMAEEQKLPGLESYCVGGDCELM